MATSKITSAKAPATSDTPTDDAIYESVMTCEPVFPPEEMDKRADLVFSQECLIRSWRLAALLGSKDGAFYKELSTNAEKAKALAAAVDPMRATAELLRGIAETMDCVAARVMVAGCNHEEFNAWMEVPHG